MDDTEIGKISDGMDTWKGLLDNNLAYQWSKYYLNNAHKVEFLRAKQADLQSKGGDLNKFDAHYLAQLEEAENKIAESNGDTFEAFRSAKELPEDDSGEVETLIFSAGPAFEYSRKIHEGITTNYSTGISISTTASQGSNLETEAGPDTPVAKVSFESKAGASVSIATSQNYGRSFDSGSETEQKVGFVLQDDDVGDNIATRVYTDPVWGTPLFIQDSGSITSDPWEAGTQKAVDIRMELIPTQLSFRFGIPFDSSDANDLDDGIVPQDLLDEFTKNDISPANFATEIDEAGSRWVIKVPAMEGNPSKVYPVRLEVGSDARDRLNVYEETVAEDLFDYQTGTHYKIKLIYQGQRDLDSDATTIDFKLYAPQTDNTDNLTVRFNGATPPPFYIVGLTKEAPNANIVVSLYPPEVDQGNSYEKGYSLTILAEEAADAQINFPLPLNARFADLRPPTAIVTKPYEGQRISPEMFGDTNDQAFTIEVLSEDIDLASIRIESCSKGINGVWGTWSLLSDLEWKAGSQIASSPFIFSWQKDKMKLLGDGEYSLRALATDIAGNQDRNAPTVLFIIDSREPTVLSTVPDYQAKESERIYRGELSLIFTDDMRAKDFTPETFDVIDLLEEDPLKKDISGFVSYSPALRKAVFVPEIPFRPNGLYQVTVKTDDMAKNFLGLHDLAGNSLDQDFTWTFRTTDSPFEEIWSISLKVTDNSGSIDANNIAGVEYGALDGEDEKDARAVPPLTSQLQFSFLDNNQVEFDRDIRPADGRLSHHWFFKVENPTGDVTISWEPSQKLIRSRAERQYKEIQLVEFIVESDQFGQPNILDIADPNVAKDNNGLPEEVVLYTYTLLGDEKVRYFRLDVQKSNVVATKFQKGTTGWKFFSIPIDPERKEPFVNLGDDIESFKLYKYDTRTDSATRHGYKIYPLDIGEVTLETGYGYFSRLEEDVYVDVGGVYNTKTVTLDLPAEGWHAIGNPFYEDIDLSTHVRVIYSGAEKSFDDAVSEAWISGTLYRWDTLAQDAAFLSETPMSDNYKDVADGKLKKWEGYWLKTLHPDIKLRMDPPTDLSDYPPAPEHLYPPMSPALVCHEAALNSTDKGQLDLSLSLTSDFASDLCTKLGTHQNAQEGWDQLDSFEPPVLSGTVAAYFDNKDWEANPGLYNIDYRPLLEVDENCTWNLTINTDKPKAKMNLSWEKNIAQVPDDIMLCFRQNSQTDWQDMRIVQSVNLTANSFVTDIPFEVHAERFEISPPSDVKVVAGEAKVEISWEKKDNPFISNYTISRSLGDSVTEGSVFITLGSDVNEFFDTEVQEEVTYTYQIGVRFKTGAELKSDRFTVTVLPVIKETALLQSYPNPFNPETWIPYELAKKVKVTIEIYNISGQLVRKLDIGMQTRGRYTRKSKAAYWNGRNQLGEQVASGIYFYTIQAGDFTSTRKMVIHR